MSNGFILEADIALNSSVIDKVRWDDENGEMVVTLHSGETYAYECDLVVYHGLVHARSAGRFYNNFVKGKYNGRKVNKNVRLSLILTVETDKPYDAIFQFDVAKTYINGIVESKVDML